MKTVDLNDSLVIAGSRAFLETLAHELGHVLALEEHSEYGDQVVTLGNYTSPLLKEDKDVTVLAPRRITDAMQEKIYKREYATSPPKR